MKQFSDLMNEAVKVELDRWVRSHGGKKPKGSGGWMFTNARMGEGEMFMAKYDTFAGAKKQAQAWAKERGYSTIYVMEGSEELSEASDKQLDKLWRDYYGAGLALRKYLTDKTGGYTDKGAYADKEMSKLKKMMVDIDDQIDKMSKKLK